MPSTVECRPGWGDEVKVEGSQFVRWVPDLKDVVRIRSVRVVLAGVLAGLLHYVSRYVLVRCYVLPKDEESPIGLRSGSKTMCTQRAIRTMQVVRMIRLAGEMKCRMGGPVLVGYQKTREKVSRVLLLEVLRMVTGSRYLMVVQSMARLQWQSQPV